MANRKLQLLILCVSSFVSLMGALTLYELYLRSTVEKRWDYGISQFDEDFGWSLIPNASNEMYGKRVSTNAMGFRGPAIDDSRKHILILGDSVTWGYGVDDGQTMSAYLQGLMDSQSSDYQVLNLGVSGYGIGHYYMQLKKYIGATNPSDVVVVIYSYNDLTDTRTDMTNGRNKPLFVLKDGELALRDDRVKKYSCHNLFSRMKSLDQLLPRSLFCSHTITGPKNTTALIARLLYEIESLTVRYGARFRIVLTPSRRDYEKKTSFLEFFQALLKSRRYDFVDYFSIVKNDKERKPKWLYMDNGHHNEYGNKRFAGAIFRAWFDNEN